MSYFVKDGYMFSFDLKIGYHNVDIAQEHQTFLGFSWRAADSIKEIFDVFTVLPFGLSSAPYVFTKVLKPLEKYWRVQGLCIAIFLDDGWAIVQGRESYRIKARTVRADKFCATQVLLSMKTNRYGNRPSIGLAGYYLEFCIRYFENCGKENS